MVASQPDLLQEGRKLMNYEDSGNTCTLNWRLIEALTPEPPFAKNSPRIILAEKIEQLNTIYDQVQQRLDELADDSPQTTEHIYTKRLREISAALNKPLTSATNKSATVKRKIGAIDYAIELLNEFLTELNQTTPEDLARQECAAYYRDGFSDNPNDSYNPYDIYDLD
ncbi:hypothetical protein IJF89_02005 [Candidatus Saccharibacteria bacterium]|nr:hypothetical protein [Candidatus Saccharibacteria bacterium]